MVRPVNFQLNVIKVEQNVTYQRAQEGNAHPLNQEEANIEQVKRAQLEDSRVQKGENKEGPKIKEEKRGKNRYQSGSRNNKKKKEQQHKDVKENIPKLKGNIIDIVS